VYTSNESGYEQVYVFTMSTPPTVPALTLGCDPARTDLIGTSVVLTEPAKTPVLANGVLATAAGRTYFVCVENGKPDGTKRTSQFLFNLDSTVVLNADNFAPATNPPEWVAAQMWVEPQVPTSSSGPSKHSWSAALFASPGATVTISIRALK
jgi:hypothetical protein